MLAFENVLATQDGEVIFSQDGWNDGFGTLMKLRHSDGNVSWYAHLNARYKNSGNISRGDAIAQSGNTGNSTGAHLHFEVRNSSNQSIWIRDLPTTTWYTKDINNPCMPPGQYDGEATPTESSGQCTDNNNPDGNYDQPGNNQQVSDSVHLKGWAKDDCGVDYVEFTATWPGQGWKVVKRVDTDCGRGDTCTYEYNWDISGLPDGWITLGYDIYDKSGKKSLSPHGTRRILKVGKCDGPGLREPSSGWRTKEHTITFKWNDVSCTHTGYRLRVKTVSDMDSGGETLADVYVNGAEHTLSFGNQWENRSLYWSVRAENAPGGARWANTREFQIGNEPPRISFDTANGRSDNPITSRDQTWTFRGTAGDPEGRFSRVEFRCNDCDNRGSGEDRSASTNWAITRYGMSGRNYVFFEAFDDRQSARSARTLQLDIDLAPPTTEAQVVGNAPYGWFTEPAQVRLTARDNNTGRAAAGVREIRYRRDAGGEQVQPGASLSFSEGNDGVHTVRYYAVDHAGNVEAERTATYRVDRTPPTAIGGVSESSGAADNVWQRTQNRPTFTWAASSDALSGLGGYQFYFGADPNGTAVHFDVGADEPRTLTPNNLGVATGTYYLRGRTWDRAGNTSAWQTLFTFRYDGTPPENPTAATHALGATVVRNDVWQRASSVADFTWPVPHDEGAGIKGYSVYWGADPAGTSASFITANRYQSGAPLCGANAACTGYLRLRSRDNVDNEPAGWSTVFVLRYDNAAPVADFTFREGITTTQTLVNLRIAATDQGSGVREMRLSGNGQDWTPWEAYAEERPWTIPAISRQAWPGYLQVRDGVGLTSTVISRTIYLDVNPQQPRSAGFRLFDYAMSAGGGDHASTGYRGSSTVGQVVDSAVITSTGYILRGGYQAGSRAIPLQEPGHDEFTFINGIFASGVGANTLTSPAFRMVGTLGEIGVPNNETTLQSQRHQLQPGFLAAAPRAAATPTPTPGPTPTPTPTPACEFPTISINDGAVFAASPNVTLRLCAPNAKEMKISNDGGFGDAQWEPYAERKAWTLTTYGAYVLPRFVYAAFRDARGQIYAAYLDDIILDPVPPEARVRVGVDLPIGGALLAAAQAGRDEPAVIGRSAWLTSLQGRPLATPLQLVTANADGAVDLYLSARDGVGNVTRMQVSEDGSFGADWESYHALKQYTPTGGDGVKTVYARFQDEAGNVSQPVTATFALDTLPPIGGIALSQPILGPDVVTTTVWLGAEDNLSGVAAMRLSTDPTFADAVWQPFAPTLRWVYAQADRGRAALHVQYRDAAGNESEVYAAPLLVDDIPPQVYVEVEPGDTLTRIVRVYAYDGIIGESAGVSLLRLTNDPLFLDGVVTQPFTDTVAWTFDERRVVWVQARDGVGNWSEPYPAYAAPAAAVPTQRIYLPLVVR